MRCKKCGNEMNDRDQYCNQCDFDNQLDYIESMSQSPATPADKKVSIPLLITTVLVVNLIASFFK